MAGDLSPPTSIAQSLPSYIIYEILKHFSAPLVLHRIAQYPWYLSHVCSSWRIAFLTMRRNFWNEIIVHCSIARMHQHMVDALTMFLERNCGHPFSFELDVKSSAARKSPHFFAIINLLISESPRWRRATLKMRMGDIPGFYRVKGQLDHLESLHFSCSSARVIVQETFTDLFIAAPCLTRLSLNRLSKWDFDWSIMTFMDLGYNKRDDVARLPCILSQAMRLETLIIYFGFETPPSVTPIVLPSLLSLVTDKFSLMQAITTPSLKKLRVDHGLTMYADRPKLAGILKSFFDRSQCYLQELRIRDLKAPHLIETLSHTPDLRNLHLSVISDSVADVFGWLNGAHPKTPKLTHLQSLVIHDCTVPPQNQTYKIFDFLDQRKTQVGSGVEKLQKLNFEWLTRSHNREVYKVLEERVREECKRYNIQYSNDPDNDASEVLPNVHKRSPDRYVYHLDWDDSD